MNHYLGYAESWLVEQRAIHTAKEIEQQPKLWRNLVGIIEQRREEADAFLDPLTSNKDLRIILTGAGTSAFAGEAIAPYLQQFNNFNVEAIATTDIVSNPEQYLQRDRVTLMVSFARSGNSPESVAAVKLADQLVDECHHLFLTCNPDGELSVHANNHSNALCILMPEGSNDKSFAMTSSFSCMTMACIALLGGEAQTELIANVERIATMCESKIQQWIEPVRSLASLSYNRLVVLGSGGFCGLAREAALKSLELSAGKVMAAFDSSLGFRHGPKFSINEQTLVVQFVSTDGYTRKYDIDLFNEIKGDGQALKLIAIAGQGFDDEQVIELGGSDLDQVWLSFPYILFAQMLAFEKSLKLELGPDNPCPSGEVNRVVQGVSIHTYPVNNH